MVRVVTLLDKSNQARVFNAVLRLGRQGIEVDNFSQGGLFISISDEGVLEKSFFGAKIRSEFCKSHPDTQKSSVLYFLRITCPGLILKKH